MSNKVCFIGHRHVPTYQHVEEKLKVAIQNEIDIGCKIFTMGTHGEFDKLALSVCREFKNKYKDIEIEVVVTSFNTIKSEIYEDVKTVMYEIEEEYFKKQITSSNRQMVAGCDTLICFVDETQYRSGAKTAIRFAKKLGLNIINLYKEEDEPTYGMTKEQKQKYWKSLFKRDIY